LFGANYIPLKNWLHNLVDYAVASVEEDLYAAKKLGVDHIRAHIMWHYFQIDPTRLSSVYLFLYAYRIYVENKKV